MPSNADDLHARILSLTYAMPDCYPRDTSPARYLADAVEELDRHLRHGGRLPEAWAPAAVTELAAARAEAVALHLPTDHPTVPGSNAPAEDGPHAFEHRDADDADRYDLDSDGCDYCGQPEADPIHAEAGR